MNFEYEPSSEPLHISAHAQPRVARCLPAAHVRILPGPAPSDIRISHKVFVKSFRRSLIPAQIRQPLLDISHDEG